MYRRALRPYPSSGPRHSWNETKILGPCAKPLFSMLGRSTIHLETPKTETLKTLSRTNKDIIVGTSEQETLNPKQNALQLCTSNRRTSRAGPNPQAHPV